MPFKTTKNRAMFFGYICLSWGPRLMIRMVASYDQSFIKMSFALLWTIYERLGRALARGSFHNREVKNFRFNLDRIKQKATYIGDSNSS